MAAGVVAMAAVATCQDLAVAACPHLVGHEAPLDILPCGHDHALLTKSAVYGLNIKILR